MDFISLHLLLIYIGTILLQGQILSVTRPDDLKDLTCVFCMTMNLLSGPAAPCSPHLVASHAVAVEDANLLVLLAGHVVQALVGLHVSDLGRNDTTAAVIQNTFTHSGGGLI